MKINRIGGCERICGIFKIYEEFLPGNTFASFAIHNCILKTELGIIFSVSKLRWTLFSVDGFS